MKHLASMLVAVLAAAALVLFSACSPVVSQNEPEVSVRAGLNWSDASIQLPLDAFSMTADERSLIYAARNIWFVRCITGDNTVPQVELTRSRDMLTTPHRVDVPNWLFGWWNASYVSTHGWLAASPSVDRYMPGASISRLNEVAGIQCSKANDMRLLRPVGIGFVMVEGGDSDDAFSALFEHRMDAYRYVTHDSRYAAASAVMENCLKSSGYSLHQGHHDDYPGITVRTRDDWSGEQVQAAYLAAAQCNDQNNITQTLSDLQATYEQMAVDAHEAEFVAMRQEVEKRLAKAHELLREAGLE